MDTPPRTTDSELALLRRTLGQSATPLPLRRRWRGFTLPWRWLGAAIVAAGLTFLAMHVRFPPPSGAVQGQVRHVGGQPFAAAGISIEGLEERRTVTDNNGFYSLGRLPPGTHYLLAKAPGHRTAVVMIVVRSRETAAVETIYLDKEKTRRPPVRSPQGSKSGS